MALRHLKDVFIRELRDLYDAENQLLRAASLLQGRAGHEDLKAALDENGRQTRQHIVRLDRIFSKMSVPPEGVPSSGMKGLIKQTDQFLAEEAEDSVRDAGLIAAAQRIEHYKIAAYAAARSFADRLGLEDFAWILTESLDRAAYGLAHHDLS